MLFSFPPQEISCQIYEQLGLPDDSAEAIPSLIHLAKIRLSQFCKDKSDLVLTAPPPAHFIYACEKLKLMSANELESALREKQQL